MPQIDFPMEGYALLEGIVQHVVAVEEQTDKILPSAHKRATEAREGLEKLGDLLESDD